jgi:LuxR family quorum sensing-dependent transcriptional regulator
MTAAAQSFGREAFDFIEDLDRLDSPDSVIETMYRVVAQLGASGLFFAELDPRPPKRFEDFVLASRCPSEFGAIYTERDYASIDANIRRSRRMSRTFEWSETGYGDHDDEPHTVEFLRFLADFGFQRGFVVPIHGPGGFVAGVALAGSKLDLSARTKPMIHLMALYAFATVMDLIAARPHAQFPLTSREREVLAWSAQGKSAWEIGEILSVAKRTVDEHAQTAMRKLGATNRTQAVALAIRQRLFDI